MVWYGMVWYGMLSYGMVWYGKFGMLWDFYAMLWQVVKDKHSATVNGQRDIIENIQC